METALANNPAKTLLGVIGKVLAYTVMSIFALMTVLPILWLVMNSFKSTPEFRANMMGLPKIWVTANYPGAWVQGDFGTLIGNSVLYTLVASAGIVFFAILSGFAFAKIRSRATAPIYGSFVIGILLSIQSLMVPLFIEVSQLDRIIGGFFEALGLIEAGQFHFFYDSRIGVIMIYIGSGLPVAIYLATEYIRSIPDALVEAARIDGAGYFWIFRGVIVPMCIPIAVTVSILNITGLWNEFALINILVSKTALKTLPLGIYKFSGAIAADYGKQFAALVIGMAPMLLFYIVFRKQITKGVAAGAIKG